ncbi:MAG: hypothetical protein MUO91_09705 [candidate division Zixibacteria bacterium]|nr:hypothetical protein [candidate division Zixibacteria bacterium]
MLSGVEAQAQGGDGSTMLTVPERSRRERSRTATGGEKGQEMSSMRHIFELTLPPKADPPMAEYPSLRKRGAYTAPLFRRRSHKRKKILLLLKKLRRICCSKIGQS